MYEIDVQMDWCSVNSYDDARSEGHGGAGGCYGESARADPKKGAYSTF